MSDNIGYIDIPGKFKPGNKVRIIKTGEIDIVFKVIMGKYNKYLLNNSEKEYMENELELVR